MAEILIPNCDRRCAQCAKFVPVVTEGQQTKKGVCLDPRTSEEIISGEVQPIINSRGKCSPNFVIAGNQ